MFVKALIVDRTKKFIDNPSAIFYFLRRTLYDQFIVDKTAPFYRTLRFLSPEETLEYLLEHNSSVVRLGDGEFALMRGASVYFNGWHQQFSKGLRDALYKVATTRSDKVMLCVPGDCLTKTQSDFEAEGKGSEFKYWVNAKVVLKDLLHKDKVYGSPFVFYPNVNTGIDYQKLKNFFLQKNIIIITSGIDRFKGITLGKTTTIIEAPSNNGWDSISDIRKKLETVVENGGYKNEETLIMVAMGPAAKGFVYELSMKGFIAWDAGQFFDLAYKKIKDLS